MNDLKKGSLKRLLSLFLALVMCLGMLPVGVFAADTVTDETELIAALEAGHDAVLGGHVTLAKDLTIPSGTTLDCGTSVLFVGGYVLTVQGKLTNAIVSVNGGYIDLKRANTAVKIDSVVLPSPGNDVLVAVADNETIAETAKITPYDSSLYVVKKGTGIYLSATDPTPPVEYTVTYAAGATGVTLMPETVTGVLAGSYIVSNATPVREGYIFGGWDSDTDGTADVQPGGSLTIVDADVTLTAVWTADEVEIDLTNNAGSTATVAGIADEQKFARGSTVNFKVTAATGYDASTIVATKNGIELVPTGIVGDASIYSFVADTDTVAIVIGAAAAKQYTVTLPVGDNVTATFTDPSTGDKITTVDSGTTVKFSITAKNGYDVNGVYANGVALTGTDGAYEATITADTNITVDASAKDYFTVNVILDGQGFANFPQVEKNANLKALLPASLPTKTGYTFDDWYVDAAYTTKVTTDDKVTANTYVYGKFDAEEYKISYDLQGGDGTMADTVKTYGQAVQLAALTPSRTGYTFMGWALAVGGAPVYQPSDMFSTEISADTTLYAIWEVNTYSVILPTGTGYSIITEDSTIVEYNDDFTFDVKVDRDYASTEPEVKVNGTALDPLDDDPTADTDGSKTYTYVIEDIAADQIVTIVVVENQIFTVTFNTKTDDTTPVVAVYMTQEVEDGYCATQPVDPVIEGYKFEGWFAKADFSDSGFDFTAAITEDTIVYAKMVAVKPVVTIPAEPTNGAFVDNITDPVTTNVTTAETATVAYGDDVTFTVTVQDGFDASNMKVGANGLALAPVDMVDNGDGTVTYTFLLSNVKEDTKVTIVGIVPKTVTITYMANAQADVEGLPGPQTVSYCVDPTNPDPSNAIDSTVPVRNGYTFKGWNKAANAAVDAADMYQPGDPSDFVTDTVLYAIWEDSKTVTIEIEEIDSVAIATLDGTPTPAGLKADGTAVAVAAGNGVSVTFAPATGKTLDEDSVKVYVQDAAPATTYTGELADYTVTLTDGKVKVDFTMPEKNSVKIVVSETPTFGGTIEIDAAESAEVDYANAQFVFGGKTVATDVLAETTAKTLYTFANIIPAGADVQFTYKLVDGYHFDELTIVDANNQAVEFTATEQADGSVIVAFVMPASAITAKILTGADYSLTYVIEDATATKVDDSELYKADTANTLYGAEVTDVKVGDPAVAYTIQYNAPGAATIKVDDKVVFTVTANTTAINDVLDQIRDVYVTYQFNGVDKEVELTENSDGSYAFNMPEGDAIIHVELKDYTTVAVTAPAAGVYEETEINLTATVEDADTFGEDLTAEERGTVYFYWATASNLVALADIENPTNATPVGSAEVMNDGTATITNFKVPTFDSVENGNCYIYAVYKETPYFLGSFSGAASIQVLSTAISWKLTKGTSPDPDAVEEADATITIYKDDGDGEFDITKDTAVASTTAMTATDTYFMKLPAVYALDDQTAALKVGTDYEVQWLYKDPDNGWTDSLYASADVVKLTPELFDYSFKAVVKPLVGATTPFTKAAAYEEEAYGNLVAKSYLDHLVTVATKPTVKMTIGIELVIEGAINEAANVSIAGATPFETIGDHWAQFEQETVTLVATMFDRNHADVTEGTVDFYLKDGTLIGTAYVDEATAKATFDYVIDDYDDTKAAEESFVDFYATYRANETYNTASSIDNILTATGYHIDDDTHKNYERVYVMSRTIDVPVITHTSYDTANEDWAATADTTSIKTDDVAGLAAGVPHLFELVANNLSESGITKDTASVIAIDGRLVPAEEYSVEWFVFNDAITAVNSTGESISTLTTAELRDFDGEDRYYNATGTKIWASLYTNGFYFNDVDSKCLVIEEKQDVTIVVTTDPAEQYQRNEVTIGATVEGADFDLVIPSGTVTFFYSVDDGATWTQIGEAAELVDGYAEITTCDLPVTADTFTYEEMKISASYSGDIVFNVLEKDAATGITTADETIYSSDVYTNKDVENKILVSDPTNRENGIVIAIEGDKELTELLKANEPNVNLTLSKVYTLDYAQSVDDWAYLPYTTGDGSNVYTVTWQYCNNYVAYDQADPNAWPWETMGSDADVCQVTVADNVAYRAMITVLDTDSTRASWECFDQDAINDPDAVENFFDGRKVYYSNILVAKEGEGQITVNVNTSNVADGAEGIVEGETVTVNTFVSGAVGTTPIANVTVKIVNNETGDEVFNENSDNVNGFVGFDWTTEEPGYYTLTVEATFTNGYEAAPITRTLIVRDDKYDFEITEEETTYNGKAQGVTAAMTDMGIEAILADQTVVVYYYADEAMTEMVEPKDAGTYYYKAIQAESAFWTEKSTTGTFIIKQREVAVEDLVAQAKVYDGTTAANIQEIVLADAEVDANGVATGETGLINGDSLYATGTGLLSDANAGTVTLSATDVVLAGDDAANYTLKNDYTEDITILRNQLKGDIAAATYRYATTAVPADDVYLIDQQGNAFSNYKLTYYYHNGEGVEKVACLSKLGMYTVVATAVDEANYKGGASEVVYVAVSGIDATPDTTATSATIEITNTVELFGGADNTGIVATASNGEAVTVTYNGSATVPTDAGRYLVKATASTGDTAYGLYTIVKANQAATLTVEDVTYDSALQDGTPVLADDEESPETWYTWVGGTIQGVSYTAPTEVGTYVVTAHMNETANYAASEVSAVYTIAPAELIVTATSMGFHHYGSFPVLTATYSGLASNGVAADTSLRDVQIPAEVIFNDNDYSNTTLDQVGNYPITVVAALARNYNITYVDGLFSVTDEIKDEVLTILGQPNNGDGANDIVYYGDEIQLYAYGSQNEARTLINESSQLFWSSSDPTVATINEKSGELEIVGVGSFTITLKRGIGAQQISTTWTAEAKKQEVKVDVPNVDKVYSGAAQTYDGTVTTVNAMLETVTATTAVDGGDSRTDVGSQITTYEVDAADPNFCSEIYGGLYTINDADVTVAPNAQTVIYGDTLTIADEKAQCTVTGEVGGVEALTGYQVASIRELYTNLDVANEYEILVAGTENINYNVKYITAPNADTVAVTAKTLTISSGAYADTVGSTDGSLLPEGVYPESGAEMNVTTLTKTGTSRMYGEPNEVMGFELETLIDGDSMADLDSFEAWLAEYTKDAHRLISAEANVTYLDKTAPVDGHTVGEYEITEISDYIDFANYTETYVSGNQDIFQRPVVLKCTLTENELLKSTNSTDLKAVMAQNITAEKLSGEGGLALKLKHTVQDLNLEYKFQLSYDGATYGAEQDSFSSLAGVMKLKVIVRVTNPNYYAAPLEIVLDVTPTKYVIEIVEFKQSNAIVNLYEYNTETGTSTLTWFAEDAGIAAGTESNAMVCKIYNRVEGKTKYVDYSASTPVVNAKMIKGDTVGRYTIDYSALYGSFRMFAIADGYIIIDNT